MSIISILHPASNMEHGCRCSRRNGIRSQSISLTSAVFRFVILSYCHFSRRSSVIDVEHLTNETMDHPSKIITISPNLLSPVNKQDLRCRPSMRSILTRNACDRQLRRALLQQICMHASTCSDTGEYLPNLNILQPIFSCYFHDVTQHWPTSVAKIQGKDGAALRTVSSCCKNLRERPCVTGSGQRPAIVEFFQS